MSKKQKKLIMTIVGVFLILAGLVLGGVWIMSDSDDSGDLEAIKATGGYETLKSDLVSKMKVKDSQAARIADTLFGEVGIKKYQSLETGKAKRGNTTINCDDNEFDCFIQAGEFDHAYIGNVLVYKSKTSTASTVATALNYSYEQYNTLVKVFTKEVKVDDAIGKQLYSELTWMGINGLTEIKSGKLNGTKGFYGYESTMKYFFTLTSDGHFDKVYVVCDGFDPILVFNRSDSNSNKISTTKVLMGTRQGIANVLGYRVKTALAEIEPVDEVIFPAALLTGDDSWLMVNNGTETYLEVIGQIKKGEESKSKDFVMKVSSGSNELTYLKIGRKVYIGGDK